MNPKLLGLSLASSALLATITNAGAVTLPTDTVIQKAQVASALWRMTPRLVTFPTHRIRLTPPITQATNPVP